MRIESTYQEGLKQLIKEHELDEINVVMLCAEVKSNRQTFYYHFRDISDVVQSIMLKEDIKEQSKSMKECVQNVVAYTNAHFEFLSAINKSFCSDIIQDFFYRYFHKNLMKLLNKEIPTFQDAVRNLCILFSNELCFWISTNRKENQTHLIHRFLCVKNYFENEYPKNMEEAE